MHFREIDLSRMFFQFQYHPISEAYPLRLVARSSGEVTYTTTANPRTTPPELGRYHFVLAPERLGALDRLVAPLSFEALEAQQDPVATFGLVRLRVRTDARDVSLQFDTSMQPDPGLRALVAYADALAVEATAHPEWTVRLDVTDVRREGTHAIVVARFANRGARPIGLRVPAGALPPSLAEASFSSEFAEPTAPGSTTHRESQVESVELVSAPSPGDARGYVELAPGRRVDVRLRVRVSGQRGGTLLIFYNNQTPAIDGHALAVGVVTSLEAAVPAGAAPE